MYTGHNFESFNLSKGLITPLSPNRMIFDQLKCKTKKNVIAKVVDTICDHILPLTISEIFEGSKFVFLATKENANKNKHQLASGKSKVACIFMKFPK